MQPVRMKGRLRRKMVWHMFVVTLLVLLATTSWGVYQFHRSLMAEFHERGKAITRSLAASSIDAIQSYHQFMLQNYVEGIDKKEKAVKYAMVVEQTSPAASGKILAHSDSKQVGQELSDPFGTLILEKSADDPVISPSEDEVGVRLEVPGKPPIGYVRLSLDNTHVKEGIRKITQQMIGVALLGFVVGMVVVHLFASKIADPVQQLAEKLNEMATSGGDLTQMVTVEKTGDEIEALAEATNCMRAGIRQIVLEVMHVANTIQAATRDMAASCEESSASLESVAAAINEVARGTDKEADEVRQVRKIMGEISEIVRLAIETAEKNSRIAQEALSTANSGGTAVAKSFERVAVIRESIENTSKLLAELQEKTKEISQINEVIKNIANDTRLFSLNTRVEASRLPYESAKPFIIIAKEIRRLSLDTQDHSSRIGTLVEGIVGATRQCGEAALNVVRMAKEGVEATTHAQATIQEITAGIERSGKEVALIGTVTQELAKANKAIMDKVEGIFEISTQNAISAEEVSASTEEQTTSIQEVSTGANRLKDSGDKLIQTVGIFKV